MFGHKESPRPCPCSMAAPGGRHASVTAHGRSSRSQLDGASKRRQQHRAARALGKAPTSSRWWMPAPARHGFTPRACPHRQLPRLRPRLQTPGPFRSVILRARSSSDQPRHAVNAAPRPRASAPTNHASDAAVDAPTSSACSGRSGSSPQAGCCSTQHFSRRRARQGLTSSSRAAGHAVSRSLLHDYIAPRAANRLQGHGGGALRRYGSPDSGCARQARGVRRDSATVCMTIIDASSARVDRAQSTSASTSPRRHRGGDGARPVTRPPPRSPLTPADPFARAHRRGRLSIRRRRGTGATAIRVAANAEILGTTASPATPTPTP